MRPLFNVTYERVTPESAEHGDADDRGFIAEGVTLRDAVYAVNGSSNPAWLPFCEADGCPVSLNSPPRWFNFYEVNDGTREYFEQGVEESRAIHLPDSITPASAMRVARLFRCYGVK